jgi:tetratricopeptide (TPR) repeat protein
VISPADPESRSDTPDDQVENVDPQTKTGGETAPQTETPSDVSQSEAGSEATESQDEELPEWEPLTPELVEDEAIRGDFMLRWAVILMALPVACTEISETAVLVHVKMGQYMAAHGWLPPRTDVLSYTADERSWPNLSWLFDLGVAGLFAIGGAVGLSFLKGIVAAVAFGLIVQINLKNVSSWWGSVCAALALIVCYPRFTAMPELITLLGIALTLWLLHRWRETEDSNSLWKLVGVFLVWSNLDPRMFLGLALVILYAMGQSIGHRLGRETHTDAARRKHLWIAVAGCIAACLVNPFGWHSLTAPFTLYGVEYPAFREYYADAVGRGSLQYFPMTDARFWKLLSRYEVAALFLIGSALATMVLNRKKVDLGHVFVFGGFVGFAVAGSHELAVVSIVCSVLGTLNAQAWYRSNFRQSYGVKTSEIIYSRGGRAVTVLAFLALAYLAISGRLGGPGSRRTGVGFHSSLQTRMDGLKQELENSFDDQPFNFLLAQGDLLIWSDQKVFIDSRLALYRGTGDDNLVDLHNRTRHALLRKRQGREHSGNRTFWQETFNRFQVTHVLPRLSGMNPDYETYSDLLVSADWELTQLGAASACFYRTDTKDPQLKDYVAKHRVDFIKDAFRSEAPKSEFRADFARPGTTYQKYFALPESKTPNAIQLARHFQGHLGFTSRRTLQDPRRVAMAYLAIRHANQGLAEQPQNAMGYEILGSVYGFLGQLEADIAQSSNGTYRPDRRFYQAVQAFSQSLLIEPNNPNVHLKLIDTYLNYNPNLRPALNLTPQRIDLGLREIEAWEQATAGRLQPSVQQIKLKQKMDDSKKKVAAQVDKVLSQVDQQLIQNTNRVQVAVYAYQAGCVLRALEVLEEDPAFVAQNPNVQPLLAMLLMEAGRTADADIILGKFERVAEKLGMTHWREPAIFVSLARSDYGRAVSLWTETAGDAEANRVDSLLDTMPLASAPSRWPLQQISTAMQALYQVPYQVADSLFNVALCHLESGDTKQATEVFHQILKIAPDSGLRSLVQYYLFQITGELIDSEPPSAWIPITRDMFVPDEQEQANP